MLPARHAVPRQPSSWETDWPRCDTTCTGSEARDAREGAATPSPRSGSADIGAFAVGPYRSD
jgi:hypothetical protein